MSKLDELLSFDVAALAEKLRTKAISPVEITEAYLARIDQVEEKLLAYITITEDVARQAAVKAEQEIMAGEWRGPFHGVPIALKDLCCTRGILTTAGSKVLASFVPDYDATVWARLRDAGAVLLGKLNLHEFAFGATNTNPHWGTCHNPYDLERVPGGSSGGSAAAIVAHTAAATIGTDTGGSIRIPAAFCGCVGLKQTYSRVSRYGVLPLSDSLDHAGPITRSVRDAALMLQVIAGYDVNDPTSSREPVADYAAALAEGAVAGAIKGMRIGYVKELTSGVSPEVAAAFEAALVHLRYLGAEVEEASIPDIETSTTVAMNIIFAEAFEHHENWLREQASDYSSDIRSMLEAAMLLPASAYVRAQRARSVMLAQALDALEGRGVLVAPTVGIPAPRIGVGARALDDAGAPVDMNASVIRFTAPFNTTGQPVIAVPTGISATGLPLSMQIIGRPFAEATILQVASAYEATRGPLPPPKL